MSSLPASRLDTRREFLSRLGATVQIADSIVVPEPSEASTSSSEGTSQGNARDRLDRLLGLFSSSSSSVSASSSSCQDHISTFPSMCIFSSSPPRSPSSRSPAPPRHQEVQDSASAEQIASSSLSFPVAYERREISSAPERLARSVTTTYTSLIEANIRQVTRNLRIRREDLPPIRIVTVSTSFEDIVDSSCDNEVALREGETNIRLSIDFLLSIDNALATFTATASGSLTCHFSKDTARGYMYHHIDSVNLTIDGHQLLFSLRKQARVAALFVLMAGASANGGAIGGSDAFNGQVADADVGDARPQPQLQPQPRAQRQEEFAAVAAAQRPLRCVSPEPIEIASFPCIEMRNKRRRRLDP